MSGKNKKYRNRNSRNNFSNNTQESDVAKLQEYKRFASTSAILSGNITPTNTSSLTEARLKSMLQDPAKNAVQVAGLSASMKNVNGIYKRIIKYLSSILTFDHVIYPALENPLAFAEDPQAMQMAFAQSAVFLDRLNPRFHLPIFTEKVFTKGVTYQYKLEDSKSIAYQEFPTSYCRISYIEDGVHRFHFDVTKLSDATMLYFLKRFKVLTRHIKMVKLISLSKVNGIKYLIKV